MALLPVGVSFKAENINKFVASLGQAAETTALLGDISGNTAYKLDNFYKSVDKSTKQFQAFINVGKEGGKIIGDAFGGMNKKIEESDSALGRIAQSFTRTMGVFRKIGGVIGGIVGALAPQIAQVVPIVGQLIGAIGAPAVAYLGSIIGKLVGNVLGWGPAVGMAVKTAIQEVIKAIAGFFEAIITTVASLLGKTISKIVSAGIAVGKAFIRFGESLYNTIKNVVVKIIDIVKKFFNELFGMFGAGNQAGRGGWRSLGASIFGAMFKFEVLKQVIRGVITQVKEFAGAAFDAAVEVQTLTIRINNLIAGQVRNAKITDDYNKSINITSGATQDLLVWIEKLALSTPISVEDVGNTVTLSIAMGWAVDEAKELTKSIIDYTAATGLGSEISERIIYNFAQMKQQGKVTGTELRDLGRGAFMPINKILEIMYEDAKNATDGMEKFTGTFEDFKTAASEGTVDVNKFFKAFNEFVAKNMPDAAYRMNFTFAAVKDNIRDLFKVLLGWNVLGPMIKSITKPMQDFIDKMKSEEVLLAANRIGQAMAFLIESIRTAFSFISSAFGNLARISGFVKPSIESVVKSIVMLGLAIQRVGMIIGDFINRFLSPLAAIINKYFGQSFKNMSNNFFTYGANIIINFAKGMIQAASKFLTIAIKFISSILSYFFKPGSPPKIAPEIDKWGMETINEWLHGFTQADFSILDSMKSTIKEALTALVDLGQLTDTQALSMYVDYTVELIEAMDEFNRSGKVSADIFDKLRSIGGVYGTEIAELFDLQLQLAIATERATQAQKDYDEAIKASARSEVKTNKLIRDYNAMVRKGASKNLLKDKLKLVNASQIEFAVNKKAEITTKSALDLALEQQKVMEDQVKLQESLIKELTDLAQASKEVAGAAGEMAKALEEALAEAGGITWELTDPTKDWDLDKWITDATLEFNQWWETNMPTLSKVWYDSFVSPNSDFQKALATIKPSFEGVVKGLKSVWNEFANTIGLPTWEEIAKAWTGVEDIITPSTAREGHDFGGGAEFGGIGNNYAKVSTDVVGRFRAVIQKFSDAIKADGGILAIIKGIGQYLFDKLTSAITGDEYGGEQNLGTGGRGHSYGGGVEFVPKPVHATIMNLLTGILNDIRKALAKGSQFRKDLGALADQVMTIIADTLFGPQKKEKKKGAGGTMSPGARLLEGIKDFIADSYNDIVEIGKSIGGPLIEGVKEGITSKINESFANKVKDSPFSGIITSVAKFFGIDVDNVTGTSGSTVSESWGGNLVRGLFNGIGLELPKMNWDSPLWDVVINAFKLLFGISSDSSLFMGYGANIVNGLATGIKDTIDAVIGIGGTVDVAVKSFISAVASFLGINTTPDGKSRSKNSSTSPFYSMGQAIVQGIINGFESMIQTLKDKWNALIDLIPGDAAEAWHIESPSKLFRGYGVNIVKGLAIGITDSAYIARNAMRGLIGNTEFRSVAMNAPMSAPPVYGGNTANFNGDIHINNGMDWALFKAQVQRAIVEG